MLNALSRLSSRNTSDENINSFNIKSYYVYINIKEEIYAFNKSFIKMSKDFQKRLIKDYNQDFI